MGYGPIVQLVVQKGVDAVQVPEAIRSQVMFEAGRLLFQEGKYEEAGKAIAKSGNTQALKDAIKWLLDQGRFKAAAYFVIHSGDVLQIENIASLCMREGIYPEAKLLFQATQNHAMTQFIAQNFQ